MDRWTEIELFVQTAELGSLTRAAENLEMSNAAASRYLNSLERRLSARLIERSTRRLYLTQVGEQFFRRCKELLAEMKEAEADVSANVLEPGGTLTVTASLSFSMIHIAPLLPEFTARYPKVSVNIIAANRYYDIMDSGIDLAIRTREFEPDSNLTVRRLAQTRRILAASPKYLDQRGTPRTVEDLANHAMLIYSYANRPNELIFTRGGEEGGEQGGEKRVINVRSTFESNDGQVLRAAALKGMGILVQPKYILYDDIVAGRLVPVLDEWDLPRLTVNIAFQNRAHLPARIRLFIEFLVDNFRRMDYERKWTS
ncbi:LysR family transcriptional regulator [Cupriavidus plantarum]|uniref:LysR family transcriptional regulator n=1 Tax=Cupriavidus plantarum TaxID=942865 RepID=UPI000EB4B23D|nr:LysR family transcriptional regulator [Cupriavidus plantarum]NYI00287.1 DNA-binding transcriptional LysR family regulator [Cupriavidus plantarum]RLK31847.1 LysR family transcriptional regulator [Cupriavidus plantarum]